MTLRRTSKPPFSRINAHIAATKMATILVSNMPEVPDPYVGKHFPGSSLAGAEHNDGTGYDSD